MNASKNHHSAARTVSIGLPVFNGEDFLAQALDSILGQDFADFEVIIADNASTDRTAEICKQYVAKDPRIKYVRHPKNMGAAKNYNYVVNASSGEFFKWAAHDDVLAPEFLSACLEEFEDADDRTVLVYPNFQFTDAQLNPIPLSARRFSANSERPLWRLRNSLNGLGPMVAVFGLFRRSALVNTKLIDDCLSSDYDLLIETALLGKIVMLDGAPLFIRRFHDNVSTRAAKNQSELLTWFDADAALKPQKAASPKARFLKSVFSVPGLGSRERMECASFILYRSLKAKTRIAFRSARNLAVRATRSAPDARPKKKPAFRK